MGKKDWEIIGKEAETNRRWIPLCPQYPNLKGVTCEEIDDFVKQFPIPLNRMPDTWNSLSPKTRKAWAKSLEVNIEDEEMFKRSWSRLPKRTQNYLRGKLELEIEKVEDNEPTQDIVEDYLQSIVMYDRDEEYNAMKLLGYELGERIWETMPIEEKMRLVKRHPNTEIFVDTQKHREYSETVPFDDTFLRMILEDGGTIYVTTPRGGHETLSIFSYANQIPKHNIPSDIAMAWDEWEIIGEGGRLEVLKYSGFDKKYSTWAYNDLPPEMRDRLFRPRGANWLGDKSDAVKRVVIVDDIVASGMQINSAYHNVRRAFPDAEVFSVHLCHRDIPSNESPLNPYDEMADNYGHAVYDVPTVGMHYFKRCREWLPVKKELDRVGSWDDLSPEAKMKISGQSLGYIHGVPDDFEGDDAERWMSGRIAPYKGEPDWKKKIIKSRKAREELEIMTEVCVSDDLHKNAVSCVFPHACPDGESDKLMVGLLGEQRCSPDKRIGRRDL